MPIKRWFFADANKPRPAPQPQSVDLKIALVRLYPRQIHVASYPRSNTQTHRFRPGLRNATKGPADSPLLEVWWVHSVIEPFGMTCHDSILQEMRSWNPSRF